MIGLGRVDGWLKRPVEELSAWAAFHGVTFNGVKFGPLPGFEERGSAVVATRDLTANREEPLILVPRELILSRQNIEVFAKADKHLREVLDAVGDFGRTTRGAVLIFLLMQATISCPDIQEIGVLNPLTEYVKFLPDELLPTFWTEEELEFLTGTTLRPAVRAKFNSLLREFETVRSATENIGWCQRYWWDDDTGLLSFADWMRADAMYRSRALEFPGLGDCMMPCIDFANHASGDATRAYYETDGDGNGMLLLRKDIPAGGEVTITYGDEKGACESIFSYGFIEDGLDSARAMFLDLQIPDDDPLRPAKLAVNTAAPGFRLSDKQGKIEWDTDYVWLVVVNEEDGLDFKLKQTIDGGREVQSLWKEHELTETGKLRQYLEQEALWDVYRLRAVVLMQNRVDAQLETLHAFGNPPRSRSVREGPWRLAERLRSLELAMLERAKTEFEEQKLALLDSESVRSYLRLADEQEQEDFT
ncbi:SET domain-containing protein [Sporormia fimetaria CBS 119925]|uniref:SET domain-containing protein n=1 Tax=Sporormia fimetaria CBS 119925 TaxID=1340428 RepID=A0A6A6VGH4_9PLEO|nr:SET domain-containing protein [Sporormia fimetaria CBS 119925]